MTKMNTDTVLIVVKMAIWVIMGKIISIVETSLENLVKILPIGFESKNRILERMSISMTFLCMLVVLVCRTKHKDIPLQKLTTMIAPIIDINTIG